MLLKTRVIFITHLHGDHQLGILKIMLERDRLLSAMPAHKRSKLYVAIPTPMLQWMLHWQNENLTLPSFSILITTNTLNPE